MVSSSVKMLASVRREMLAEEFPPVLAGIDDNGPSTN